MQGATALLKLRAQEQPENAAAFRTFIQVRGQIVSVWTLQYRIRLEK